jgi:hypothetical protein
MEVKDGSRESHEGIAPGRFSDEKIAGKHEPSMTAHSRRQGLAA